MPLPDLSRLPAIAAPGDDMDVIMYGLQDMNVRGSRPYQPTEPYTRGKRGRDSEAHEDPSEDGANERRHHGTRRAHMTRFWSGVDGQIIRGVVRAFSDLIEECSDDNTNQEMFRFNFVGRNRRGERDEEMRLVFTAKFDQLMPRRGGNRYSLQFQVEDSVAPMNYHMWQALKADGVEQRVYIQCGLRRPGELAEAIAEAVLPWVEFASRHYPHAVAP